MKKLIFSLAIASLVMGMVGCKKDNNHDNAMGEGVYAPEMRIATITNENSTQTWEWGSSKLASISDSKGGSAQFDYTGNKISNITSTLNTANPMQMKYDYDDGWMTKLSVIEDNKNIMVANIRHNANDQISGLTATLNEDYLMSAIGDMIGLGAKNGSKFTFSNQDIQMAFVWSGNNVKQAILTANLSGSISASDIVDMVGSENLGEIGSFISLLSGDFPLSISVKDTMTYTYDNHHNPFYMLLTDGPMPTTLSENNPLTMENSGKGDLKITLSIPMLGEYPIEQSIPIKDNDAWTYEYNSKGFPTKISNTDGIQTITYME